jgi:hypothetical protein
MQKFILAAIVAGGLAGSAEAVTAVRPIDGYICMNLKWTGSEQDMWDESKLPSVFEQPDATSKKIGYVGATAIVASPLHVANGFAEILHLNGKKGWVEAGLLEPYKVRGKPMAKCIPSILSNGRIGMAHPEK